MGMKVDFSDFQKGMEKLIRDSIPEDLDKGLFRAGNELLRDAIKLEPRAPFKTGALRRSARVERPADASKGTAMLAGFNIVYGARWHELTPEEDSKISWTLPGSGRKYLESKMMRTDLREKYIRIIG
ncbi:MAG: HK97 gp10 family phage protein, partial [Acidobacteria bacterium]|nr:HK97 gp10 family phage protein [Acidobacteriota bacterium]